ncbi:aldehyde dehydrogenase domain-containing protein [Aspergillus bertholletiae]|uniref:Aldehyde dehydrogenase domain-containing protein n=1 Tax=Aspergillus bertholletiae TaxID=1226010 RepID=A0A5N7ARL5_9EURO|nr:aldehyde dehydrogenase domain-containing protein [Aspergillus bertholletiae]
MTLSKISGSSALRQTIPLWINGRQRVASNTFLIRSAVTEKPVYKCSSACEKDAHDALAAAVSAFPTWASTKPAVRRDILLRAADIIGKRQQELESTMREEIGADADFARFNTATAIEMFRDAAGRLSQSLTGQIPHPQENGQNALLYKVPYGVVLGIAPWNAPYLLGVRAALYPIAAGNSCILKGSELSPRCFYHIGEIFHEAGLPSGVLNIIYTQRQESALVTNSLIRASSVRKVNFTGSSIVGSIVAAEAAKALKPALMELGGKTSAIVMEDADIELAARECARGAFANSGQACMSTERILVSKQIIEPFRRAFLNEVEQWDSGHGKSCILIQDAAVKKNRRLAKDAEAKGARLLTGNPHIPETLPESGEESHLRLKPTVVDGVDKSMDIYYEESFGPTVSLYTIESEEQAVELANDTEYGLSCSIFTTDLGRGLRLARQVETGAVHINSMSVHDEAALAHGGVKNSGWGRFNAEWGINEFVQPKVVTYMD